MVLQVAIGNEFLAAEGAGKHLLTSVGPHMLEKTALMPIFFAASLEWTFLNSVLVHFY